jgi:cytosine/adenosine deaminase-related metal-dependent hydrolase
MSVFRARWVLPIAQPPIENGWVEVHDGLIVGCGSSPAAGEGESQDEATANTPFVAILPGLVNAHTHLELAWMRGQVPMTASMPLWVERLLELRRRVGHDPVEPIAGAIREARAAGTTLVGDVSNTLAAYEPLADSDMSATIFLELLGFNPTDARGMVQAAWAQIQGLTPIARLRPSVVPHAPYSVSPALLQAVADAAATSRVSIHLGESVQEVDFLRNGEGPWRELLVRLGVWSDEWMAPGTTPVEYIAAHGLLSDRLLAVHCVQLAADELSLLAGAGATVVTCPRSNRWVGAGSPPIEQFYSAGVRVAVGTDSLASVEDLNLFSELKLMRELAPRVAAREILASATKHGADALGFGDELGTIEPGRRADLIAVSLPGEVTDVEEYLLSGIEPSQVAWVR